MKAGLSAIAAAPTTALTGPRPRTSQATSAASDRSATTGSSLTIEMRRVSPPRRTAGTSASTDARRSRIQSDSGGYNPTPSGMLVLTAVRPTSRAVRPQSMNHRTSLTAWMSTGTAGSRTRSPRSNTRPTERRSCRVTNARIVSDGTGRDGGHVTLVRVPVAGPVRGSADQAAAPAIVRRWSCASSGWAGSGIRTPGTGSTSWSPSVPSAKCRTRCCSWSTTRC